MGFMFAAGALYTFFLDVLHIDFAPIVVNLSVVIMTLQDLFAKLL